MKRSDARWVYQRLLRQHGKQHWWPGDTPFEIMIGAILTQNTSWTNVERAITNLKKAHMLSAEAILSAPADILAFLLKPSGYFNIKAERVKGFCHWYVQHGTIERLKYWPTPKLREALLAVKGIGPETADDMLLYAFKRPVFVIDAYTRRIFGRIGLVNANNTYEDLRAGFESALGHNTLIFNEYHALIVAHGKDVCQSKPRCAQCGVAPRCAHGMHNADVPTSVERAL